MKIALNKRKLIVTFPLALLFTLMQIKGYQISMIYQTTVHQSAFLQNIGALSTGQAILLGVIEFPIWCVILNLLFTVFERIKPSQKAYTPKQLQLLWLLSAVLLFICWIPCFLAAYPGFYNYDAFNQVPQALYDEVPYSAHHPLAHTLFMGKIIALGYHLGGELNDGIALYCIVQMLICAVAFAYLITYILRITGRRVIAVIALLYYAFFPTVAMFAMSTTKDTLFSVLLQLSIVFLYEMLRDPAAFFSTKWKIGRLTVTVVLMCLLRKNGIYIIVCLVPFVVLLFKRYWRQNLLLFVAAILLYFVVDSGLMLALDATEGSSKEAFSVPIQQIARLYYRYIETAFEEEELALLYEAISPTDLYGYNPFLSDDVKNNLDFDVVLENKKEFFSLWLEKGIQYPTEYIQCFLENTYQAWYPGTSIYDAHYAEKPYYFDMNMCAGGVRESKSLALLEFYTQIANGHLYQKVPVVRLLFSIGAMFWVALFTFCFAIYQKNKPLLLAMLAVLFCCATVFMGPVSLVRYYLVLFYGFPVTIGFLFCGKRETTEAVE